MFSIKKLTRKQRTETDYFFFFLQLCKSITHQINLELGNIILKSSEMCCKNIIVQVGKYFNTQFSELGMPVSDLLYFREAFSGETLQAKLCIFWNLLWVTCLFKVPYMISDICLKKITSVKDFKPFLTWQNRYCDSIPPERCENMFF